MQIRARPLLLVLSTTAVVVLLVLGALLRTAGPSSGGVAAVVLGEDRPDPLAARFAPKSADPERATAPAADTVAVWVRLVHVDGQPIEARTVVRLVELEQGELDDFGWSALLRAASGALALTDAGGSARFEAVRAGDHVVVLESDHLLLVDESHLVISKAGPAELTLFVRSGGVVEGRVVDPDGVAVAGALVGTQVSSHFFDFGGTHGPAPPLFSLANRRVAITDETGSYRLRGLLPRTYRLAASHGDHQAGLGPELLVIEGETVRAPDIALTHGGELLVAVTGPDGAPVTDYDLVLAPRVQSIFALGGELGVSQPDGRHLARVPSGTYDLRVDGGLDGQAALEGVEVPESARVEVELVLQGAPTLRGRIVDREGEPVPEASIRASHARLRREALSDASGSFELRGLPAGPASLRVSAEGFLQLLAQRHLNPGEDVELVLERGASLSGEVVAGGAGVEGFELSLIAVAGGSARGPLSFAGSRFRVDAVTADTYKLIVRGSAGVGLVHGLRLTGRGRQPELVVELRHLTGVEGLVVDAVTGAPLAGVRVAWRLAQLPQARPQDAVSTGEDGSYSLEVPHDAVIRFERPGYGELVLPLTAGRARADGVHVLQAELYPTSALQVSVVAAGGGPAPGVDVMLLPAGVGSRPEEERDALLGSLFTGGGGARFSRTSADGSVRFLDLHPGSYRVEARLGSAVAQLTTTLVAGASQELVLGLDRPGRGAVGGTITWGGAPLAGARVAVSEREDGALRFVEVSYTDARGGYRIEGLGEGPHSLRVQWNGASDHEELMVLGNTRFDLELPAGELGVSVETVAGEPVPGLPVTLAGDRGPRLHVVTDARGRASFSALREARYRVGTKATRGSPFVPRSIEVELAAGGAEEVALSVVRGHTLAGRLTSARPAQGSVLIVRLRGPDGSAGERRAVVAPDGAFELTGLEAGDYELQVTRALDAASEARPLPVRVPHEGTLLVQLDP